MNPADVLDFWFGPPGDAGYGTTRPLWFTKSSATDDLVRTRFGATVVTALSSTCLEDWTHEPRAALAAIIVLDQFTRNIFRDTPRAFSGDPRALQLAGGLVDRNDDQNLAPFERWFAYMPFEHSEFLNDQIESVRLFERLAQQGMPDPLPWAIKHFDVIKRFGRFPHRNAILGRESTPAEIEFLKEQGSSF
ncbi:MAG: DUF924 domain-containing protein [Pseudomonadota bacterium]|nr:DUF924 domain-containing protein [Pseudomonadota bacterium]